jgi:hypothetical protein
VAAEGYESKMSYVLVQQRSKSLYIVRRGACNGWLKDSESILT